MIVWDEPKRLANLAKHGLDFRDVELAFGFDQAIVLSARRSRTGRERFKLVGRMGDQLVTLIVSPVGTEALAVVSARAAYVRERLQHDPDQARN